MASMEFSSSYFAKLHEDYDDVIGCGLGKKVFVKVRMG